MSTTAPSSSSTTDPMLCQQLSKYTSALQTFKSSPSTFQILHSLPGDPGASTNPAVTTKAPPPKTLYILDSSFNPPTLAHLHIATSALLHDAQSSPSPKRLVLLLATQNADKAQQPAPFEHRLLMMQIFASDLLSTLHSLPSTPVSDPKNQEIGIDIAVTTLPYFVDKSKAIQENGAYPEQMQQVHLTGFDTLIRIMDPKYYPPGDGLYSVAEFLGKHKLRVTYRTDDKWGSKEEQDVYLRDLGTLGGMEDGETKREWVSEGRIVLVEGRKEGEEPVSSTKVREVVRKGNVEELKRLVTGGVAEWIVGERLYLDD